MKVAKWFDQGNLQVYYPQKIYVFTIKISEANNSTLLLI